MIGRRAEHDPYEAAELKAAHLGQHIQPVIGIRLIHVQRLLHQLDLPAETLIGNVRPRPVTSSALQ